MFFVKKKPTVLYLIRDPETGNYMGFDNPTVYWSKEDAEFAIKRQHGRRYEPKIQWKIIPVTLPGG
jgi:hypothetical protein